MTPNLSEDLSSAARAEPDKVALISESDEISYADLDRETDRVATGLHRLGIRKGDRVAFAIGNRPAFVAAHYGTLRIGAASVPLNTRARAQDLKVYLPRIHPLAIIADQSAASEVMSAGPHSAPVFVIGAHPAARPFEEVLAEGRPPQVETSSDDLAIVAFTSGTSGMAKAVMLSHGNLRANIEQILQVPETRLEPTDRVYGGLPLYHLYPLVVVLGVALRQRATVLLDERFDPARSLEMIAERRATIVVGTPPMFVAWLGLPVSNRYDLSSVRFAFSGGSALSPRVQDEFHRRFGIEIWEGYGLTETSSVVTTTRMGAQRRGSIGKVLPGQELKIVDTDGVEVLLGDPGEIWVRGPNVFRGYWQDPPATGTAFSGGWFRTGDIAYRDEEGYLWLVDRDSDVISVSGFKVFPKEVESVLLRHPAVAEAAVVSEPDERQGQRVKAFVVVKPGQRVTEKDLVVHCTRHLARFKVPSRVEFADSLPRLESGRLLRDQLRPEGGP
jgi:long-chain acyl-CoA synthetase